MRVGEFVCSLLRSFEALKTNRFGADRSEALQRRSEGGEACAYARAPSLDENSGTAAGKEILDVKVKSDRRWRDDEDAPALLSFHSSVPKIMERKFSGTRWTEAPISTEPELMVGMWFGEFCSCCCLPLLPQLACSILPTTSQLVLLFFIRKPN